MRDLGYPVPYSPYVGLMVSTLVSRLRGLGFKPWLGSLCSVLEQDTLLSQFLLHPGIQMGTGELSGKPEMLADDMQWT